ncbi:hypothetical protein N7466_008841 [Penicillium verhagenii]|uniref:uncharacterized protein n=1 Tax=Penicillium verhagenii TaxID=1562060 RepID=UPI0025452F7D|nr:uncharacterized protein N7466_008841 [Penicillium verhagenii]KAJ5924654.1 hypothetical protein N7466_008841 [Penicillium verhagenii]
MASNDKCPDLEPGITVLCVFTGINLGLFLFQTYIYVFWAYRFFKMQENISNEEELSDRSHKAPMEPVQAIVLENESLRNFCAALELAPVGTHRAKAPMEVLTIQTTLCDRGGRRWEALMIVPPLNEIIGVHLRRDGTVDLWPNRVHGNHVATLTIPE